MTCCIILSSWYIFDRSNSSLISYSKFFWPLSFHSRKNTAYLSNSDIYTIYYFIEPSFQFFASTWLSEFSFSNLTDRFHCSKTYLVRSKDYSLNWSLLGRIRTSSEWSNWNIANVASASLITCPYPDSSVDGTIRYSILWEPESWVETPTSLGVDLSNMWANALNSFPLVMFFGSNIGYSRAARYLSNDRSWLTRSRPG